MEFRIGEFQVCHAVADGGALQTLLLHRGLELLHRKIGRLQRQRGKSREAVGLGGTKLGELLVLELHDLPRQVTVAAVPERINRHHLHVDGLGVHGRKAPVDLDESLLRAVDRGELDFGGFFAEQRAGFVEMAMGMHVDRLDPFSADHDREFLPCRFLAVRALEKAATAEDDTGSGGRTSLEKITACGHDHFLPVLLLFSERNCADAHYGQRSHATWRRQGIRRQASDVTRPSIDGENGLGFALVAAHHEMAATKGT